MSYEQRQLEFRRRVRSMVVCIQASRPCAENASGRKYLDMVGTIVHADEISCYVVVKSSLIFDDASYHIILADGSAMDISSSDFSVSKEKGYLSGFHIKHKNLEYDVNQLAAVELGGDVSRSEQVYLCDFYNGKCNVTGGQVNYVDGILFTHSCSPTPWTANGAAVFDNDGHLVGICIGNMQGPSNALPRTSLAKHLNKIFGSQDFGQFVFMAKMDGMPRMDGGG